MPIFGNLIATNDDTSNFMTDYKSVKTEHNPTDVSFAMTQAIDGLTKFSALGSRTTAPNKTEIKDLNRATRTLEAKADKLSHYTRLASINMRQRLRYLNTMVRHSQNLMVYTTQVEEIKAAQATEIQKYGLQTALTRDGHEAYRDEMQDNILSITRMLGG